MYTLIALILKHTQLYTTLKSKTGELGPKQVNDNMDNCAKCGKSLSWRERTIVVWNKQLQDGYIKKGGAFGERIEFPELKGKQVCYPCYEKLVIIGNVSPNVEKVLTSKSNILSLHPSGLDSLFEEAKKGIVFQNGENLLGDSFCSEFIEGGSLLLGGSIDKKGFLLVTNQRLLFACSYGMFAKGFAITYTVNLENIASVSQGSFGRSDKIMILDKNNRRKDFLANTNLIPTINTAITERKNQLHTEKHKEHIQIILDFSSLKDVMAKGGLVMTTCKCPICNGIVKLPEEGKVLVCEYCGTPIKPVDIFEKIKSLIQ